MTVFAAFISLARARDLFTTGLPSVAAVVSLPVVCPFFAVVVVVVVVMEVVVVVVVVVVGAGVACWST